MKRGRLLEQEIHGMFTRHWYDCHSVTESLFYAGGTWRDPLRKQKILFWSYELILSEEWERLWETLERIAFRWGDTLCITLLKKTQNAEDILHFLHSLLSLPAPCPYDPPATDIAANPAIPTIPTIPANPANWTSAQRSQLLLAVRNAIHYRRSLRILKLLGGLHFQHAASYLGIATVGKKGIYHMLEMLEMPVLRNTITPLKWPTLSIGRVTARLFSVPRTLLPKGPINPLETKEGCAFWRNVWASMKEDDIWNTYFIDDIPDEWSISEQMKSHNAL